MQQAASSAENPNQSAISNTPNEFEEFLTVEPSLAGEGVNPITVKLEQYDYWLSLSKVGNQMLSRRGR